MKDRPSLLLITPEYPPLGGGIGRYCAQIADAAAARGLDVRVIAGRPARGATRRLGTGRSVQPAAETGPQVRFLARRPGAAGSLLFLAAMSRRAVFASGPWRPDAVLCGHLELAPVGRLLRKLGLARRTATIVYGTELFSSSLRNLRLGALRRQDLVLAISGYTREAARGFGVPEGNLRVLHPAIAPEDYPSGDRVRGRAVLGIASDRPVALTVARMDPAQRHKGHEVVLEAWPAVLAALPGAFWAVAGEGGDRERLETLARERGLSGSVSFLGRVDDAALADLYAAADVFVMPSREIRLDNGKRVVEGFGIVYLEAALHGLPSVAGRAGGAVDAVADGATGLLVDPEDPVRTSEALVRLLGDKALAIRMGAAARARVLEGFDMRRNLGPILDALSGRG